MSAQPTDADELRKKKVQLTLVMTLVVPAGPLWGRHLLPVEPPAWYA